MATAKHPDKGDQKANDDRSETRADEEGGIPIVNGQPPPQFMSAKQIANTLRVTRQHIHALARQGRLPYIVVGKRKRFDINAVIAALAPHR